MKDILASLGPVTAVTGAQWGDEGKGKLVDILAEHFDVVARASGGANAGHTIEVEGKKHIFHLLPSGCLHEGKTVVLGNGMVIHLPTLLEEIKTLEDVGIDIVNRLHISHAAHIVFDYHQKIDGVVEERRLDTDEKGIGTTKRGIGPTYADKMYRTGIRMGDLAEWDESELKRVFQHNAASVSKMFDLSVDSKDELAKLAQAKEKVGKRVTDTPSFLHQSLADKKSLLIEGAQATFLDIDHGTYPFVTSSATTITGALHDLGLPPQALTSCIGVVKAYCTRVGGGPFPAEASREDGNRLRENGAEFGATTGRPRRCGWLSLFNIKRAIALNGFTHLNLTKLDVLDSEEEIPVYWEKDKIEKLPGWMESTKSKTKFEDLPENAQKYIEYIEKETGISVNFIGTGPGREEMIVR